MIKEVTYWTAECQACKATPGRSFDTAANMGKYLDEKGWWISENGDIAACPGCRAKCFRLVDYVLSKDYAAAFVPQVAEVLAVMSQLVRATIKAYPELPSNGVPDEIPY